MTVRLALGAGVAAALAYWFYRQAPVPALALVTAVTPASSAPGLPADFNAKQYLANYPDLRAAFGTDEARAARHYIEWGRAENRRYTKPI